jgi:hypothetical protein
MKKELGITLLVSFVLGALVWALSPVLGGHAEPSDAEGVYYPAALLLAGLLSGPSLAVSPDNHWLVTGCAGSKARLCGCDKLAPF